MIRKTLFAFIINKAGVKRGEMLPWWAIALKAVLFPLAFISWWLRENHGYDPRTDCYTISGVRFYVGSMRDVAHTRGKYLIVEKLDGTVFLREAPQVMDHDIAHLVNSLRDIAIQFHSSPQLRSVISREVGSFVAQLRAEK